VRGKKKEVKRLSASFEGRLVILARISQASMFIPNGRVGAKILLCRDRVARIERRKKL